MLFKLPRVALIGGTAEFDFSLLQDIEASGDGQAFFNVMGLPVKELYEELLKF